MGADRRALAVKRRSNGKQESGERSPLSIARQPGFGNVPSWRPRLPTWGGIAQFICDRKTFFENLEAFFLRRSQHETGMKSLSGSLME
jgi:hypothetical protein